MRQRVCIGLVCAIGASAAVGQTAPWRIQGPYPTGEQLHGVAMPTPQDVWSVGDYGVVTRSHDGGVTWELQNSTTTQQLNAVCFLDTLHGWAVGNAVVYTSDGGVTWRTGSRSGNLSTMYGVDFVDFSQGWGTCGGAVMHTTDGGQHWSAQSVSTPSYNNLLAIDMISASTGWVVGAEGIVLKTTNGGGTWTRVNLGTTNYLHVVKFISESEGWIAGSDTLLHTRDGGQTWNPELPPLHQWSYGAAFLPDGSGWLAGSTQGISHSFGEGVWFRQFGSATGTGDSFNRYPLFGAAFGDDQHGVTVGGGGNIFSSGDGGQTWAQRQNGSSTPTFKIMALDSRHAWSANADTEILYTTDGQFWNRTGVPFDNYGHTNVSDIDFSSMGNGWATLVDAFIGAGAVFHSSDGGASWELIDAQLPEMYTCEAVSDDVAIAAGRFVVMRYDHGDWREVQTPRVQEWYATDFPDGQTGWLVGANQFILKTTDAGATWTQQVTPSAGGYIDVSFADTHTGWIAGGVLCRTANGGASWTTQNPGFSVLGVHAVSPSVVWACGEDAKIARSTDGGLTWQVEQGGDPEGTLYTCFFNDAEQGWAGGVRPARGGPTVIGMLNARGEPGAACDPDVNCDGNLDGFDVQAMEEAVGGDFSNFCQSDPDYNHDGNLDGFDVQAVEASVGGAPCP